MPITSGPTVFRVTGLPNSDSEQAKSLLVAVIEEQLLREEKQTLKIEIAIIPSCNSNNHNGQRLIALVDFKAGVPNFLSGLVKGQLRDWQVEIDDTGEDISFDCHFHGFTQLYNTQPSQTITADIIAITGLSGHAYGSWRGKGNLGRMWLRHFLSKDLPQCRTMIYGYNSKLSSRGFGTIEDYSREFLEGIKKVRGTKETRERPLFFVAHSFGGIILARCLIRAAQTNEDDYPAIASLYKATYGILFFAVPHKGLIVDDMESMLDQGNHPRKALLEQISRVSDLLVPQLADFKDLIRDRKIVTFYETEQTRRLEQNPEDGSWARTGPFVTALDTDSAILQLPINMEIKIPIHADHSTIVKLDSKSALGYEHALMHLKDFEQDAPDVIKARFGNELPSIKRAYKHPDEDLLKSLPSAAQAAFNSYDKQHDPPCLAETRVDVLKQIMAWGDGDDEKCIFWLSGMAGTGKSTIARTVARKYYDRNHLGASFFFSRGGEDVGHAGKFFTSIAVQLANKSPALKCHICEAMAERSGIASQTLRDQWNQLVLGPLSKLEVNLLQSPLILVIDALDECEGEDDIRVILQLLGEARKLKTIRLRIFMTSRPEVPIRHGFYQIPETGHQDFVLHNISPPIIDHDISIYFEHNLGIIKQKLALAADWPGKQTIKCLVRSAGGLFIWAATACRFISDGELFAERRLSLILQSNTSIVPPEEKLNEIYIAILKNSVSDKLDDREKDELYKMMKATLGPIVILFSPLSAVSLAKLLNIPEMRTDQILGNMHSVLEVPKDQDHPIRLHHPSFRDFLLDNQRCRDERFWVDEKKAHEALAESCLRLMSKHLKRDICDLRAPGALASEIDSCRVKQYLPTDLQYACRYWVQHLQRAQIDLYNHGQVYEFFQKHFLHWLEALSLIGKISEGGHMITELSTHLSTLQPGKGTELHAMMYDAKRFILKNGSVIEMAPLQVYSSALVYSPTKSVIKKLFLNQVPTWIKSMPAVEDNWGALLQTLEGHSNWVNAVAFSPNGQLLASASDDKTARLWDPRTGTSCGTLEGHSNCVEAVAFSPDGQLLASASYDNTVRLWDPRTGTLYSAFEGHSGRVRAVAFSPNGQLFASASDNNTVRLWDPRTGTPCGALGDRSSRVRAVAFSPDGQLLASAPDDKTVRLWDPRTGMSCGTLEGHSDWVNAVAFSPNGQLLASASADNTVKLWDPRTGTSCRAFEGHSDWVNAVAFSPDGQLLASVSDDKTVRLWDPRTGASCGTLEGHSDWVNAVAFSPNGQLLASASADGTVKLWDPRTEIPCCTFEGHSDLVNAVAFSPDSQLLASVSNDKTVRLWDPRTGTSCSTLEGHSDWVNAVAFSPDGQLLASVSNDKAVRLWDPRTGMSCGTLEGHSGWVNAVAFSPNGQLLASASYNNTVRLWDPRTGTLCGTLEGHSDWVNAVAFSPNGQLLASASDDNTVRLWDPRTGMLCSTLEGHSDYVKAVVFSPDRQLLASASDDETVRLWDPRTGMLCSTLKGHSDHVKAVVFSPDGQLLASASGDGTVRLWDPRTGTSCSTLEGHSHQVNAVAFSHNGQLLASASDDNTVRLWDSRKKKLLQILCPPADYRLSSLAVLDNILVMGHRSGRVTFTGFDPAEILLDATAV